jgi:RHS repeat-associated protein
MKRYLLVFICLFQSLFCEEEIDFSLVNQTKSPIPRAAGSVNIISGNWVDQATHYETSGPDPYVVAHAYVSSSLEEGTLADGWDFFHPSDLEVFQPKGIVYNEKSFHPSVLKPKGVFDTGRSDNKATLFYRDAGGATVVFKGSSEATCFHPKLKNTGYMLCSSIDAPLRRDITRSWIYWEPNVDHWVVCLGDGTKRIYTRTELLLARPRPDQKSYFKREYRIRKEILPSGNCREFHYNSDKELSKIITRSSDNKHVLNVSAFHRKKDRISVHTSEGLTTHFSLKKLHDRKRACVVDSIIRPGKGSISYGYSDPSSRHARRIDERTTKIGRHEKIKFYREGKNDVGKRVVTVSGKEKIKFLENRVREVWTKSLPGLPLRVSHAFIYAERKSHSHAKVFEDDGCSTIYFWDKAYRPNWIGYKNASGSLLQAEHFIWGKDGDEGRLRRRTIFDESKTPIFDRQFFYDPSGNVIKETLRGSFTGRSHSTLKLDDHKKVYGGEQFSWEAQYSTDDRSLKTAEKDPLGNWTYYEYEPYRHLLTARFTCDGEKIVKREFFTYDSAGICIETITDDGSSRHKKHRNNLTRRTIHRIVPRRQIPFYGEPDEEQWLSYTREFGEQLIRTMRYIHDDKGRVVAKELVDACGTVQKRWTYSYDRLYRLIEMTDPSGRVERYTYDDAGRTIQKYTPEATNSFTYDLFDRIIEEKKTYPDGSSESLCRQYDLSGRVVTEIDARGRETTTFKDTIGRVAKKQLPAIATESGTVRPEIRYEYTGTTEKCTSPTGAISTITRSATGKPLVAVSPSGASTYFYYDARNRLVEQRDGSGLTTLYEYDIFDRPIKVEQRANDQTLSVVTKTYRGFDLIEERYPTKQIRYTYDSLGRKISEQITDLQTGKTFTTKTEHDSLHRPVRIIHEDIQTVEQVTYDVADRVIERRLLGTDGSLLSITTTSYDLAGRVIEEGVGRAGTIARTKTTYGAYGLPSSITYPDGTVTTLAYTPLYRWQDGHVYFQKVITDARGVVSEELLDSNDQPRMTLVRSPFGSMLASNKVTFSLLGKPVLIEENVIAKGEQTEVVKTRFSYDSEGHCTSCTLAEGTSDAATWHYLYDQIGRKIEEIKPSGVNLLSTYDAKGRLSSFKSSDNTISWRYSYNNQDLPEEIVNEVSGGVTRRSYNGLGMITNESLETGLTLSYDVQPTGLLSSITYHDGSCARFTYSFGRLSSIVRNGYTYQVNTRDLSGCVTQASLPATSGTISRSIDVMGRWTSVHHEAFSEERTVFDPIGCCLERTIDGAHEVFTYDFLCQLTSDNGRSATYDSLFRRIESEGKATVHNARHQILFQGDQSFHYDVDGRRTADSRFTYTYDACDRLIAVEDATQTIEYTYDSFNRRLSSTKFSKQGSDVVKERFLWQGDCEVGSVDENTSIRSLRVLGDGLGGEIGAAVLFELNGQTFIPIHDLSGHVRACLNTNGEVVEKLFYTAFGLESRTSDLSPWTFSSKRQDIETGFVYFGRRYYEPSTATWLTQDPLDTSAGPNLYAYVKNNPLTSIDIFGLLDQSNDRGLFGSLWDGICDFVSGLVGWITGGSDASQPSESSVDSPARHGPERNEATRPVLLKNGFEIHPGVKYSDRLIIYPQGSVDKFIAEFHGQNLGQRVFVHTPGATVELYEACQRCQKFMKENPDQVAAVIILYNATHGAVDFEEALLNCLGFELEVGKVLREEFCSFLKDCNANNIQFQANVIAHSQGVAIMSNILHSDDFAKNYSSFINQKLCFGGPILMAGAMNYVAIGDPASLAAMLNVFALANALWNGEINFVCPEKIEFPHNFSGSAYQKSIREFMQSRE